MQPEWIWGLVGGLMIGSAGALFLLVNGRIFGASGVIGGLVDGSGKSNAAERWAFAAGLFLLPAILVFAVGENDTHLTDNYVVVIIAGILVGLGARVANGCTSGHGVCGISRFSFRGIVATVFYLAAGGISVGVFRHLLGVI